MDIISKELMEKKFKGKKYIFFVGKFFCSSSEYAESMVNKVDLMYETVSLGFYEESSITISGISDDVLYLRYIGGGEIPIDIIGSTKIYQDGRTYGIWNGNYLHIILEV